MRGNRKSRRDAVGEFQVNVRRNEGRYVSFSMGLLTCGFVMRESEFIKLLAELAQGFGCRVIAIAAEQPK